MTGLAAERAAETMNGASKLVRAGFEYVITSNDVMLFKSESERDVYVLVEMHIY